MNKRTDKHEQIHVGWAAGDITPEQPVVLRGQFHARISEGVLDPITATALALSSGSEPADDSKAMVMVSCDLVAIPDSLTKKVRQLLGKRLPSFNPDWLCLSATHTHTGPELGPPARCTTWMSTDGQPEEPLQFFGNDGWYGIDLPAMSPDDSLVFTAGRIAETVVQAWENRRPGSIGYGLGHAVISHNRRSVFDNGESRMYGKTNDPAFSHIEGCEDHSVNLLATWDAEENLTGVVVNVAAPSQVSEHLYQVSADYWHETRIELRRHLGKNIFVLPQCSAAGDQSPRTLVKPESEERMLRLKQRSLREEIATRLGRAVREILPCAALEKTAWPAFCHRKAMIPLPRRTLSGDDLKMAEQGVAEWNGKYQALKQRLAEEPEENREPRWYVDITRAYARMCWFKTVAARYKLRQEQPLLPLEVHIMRLGETAWATNPFELFLDFAFMLKARSPAVQTFVVQLAGPGTYLPTERAAGGGGYSGVPASTVFGPDGGRELVERSLDWCGKMWGDSE